MGVICISISVHLPFKPQCHKIGWTNLWTHSISNLGQTQMLYNLVKAQTIFVSSIQVCSGWACHGAGAKDKRVADVCIAPHKSFPVGGMKRQHSKKNWWKLPQKRWVSSQITFMPPKYCVFWWRVAPKYGDKLQPKCWMLFLWRWRHTWQIISLLLQLVRKESQHCERSRSKIPTKYSSCPCWDPQSWILTSGSRSRHPGLWFLSLVLRSGCASFTTLLLGSKFLVLDPLSQKSP